MTKNEQEAHEFQREIMVALQKANKLKKIELMLMMRDARNSFTNDEFIEISNNAAKI